MRDDHSAWRGSGHAGGRRSKNDWAPTSLGDAYKPGVDYNYRLLAQRKLSAAFKKAQSAVARLTGTVSAATRLPRVKPQISPLFTDYPSTLAAHAAIGLTAFLELQERTKTSALQVHLADYLKNPAALDRVAVDPQVYRHVANTVVQAVQVRLSLEDLSRCEFEPMLRSAVELYRLFAASQEDLGFGSVTEIVRGVLLYGDVLPSAELLDLHPMTLDIIGALQRVSGPFFGELPKARSAELIDLGARWTRSISQCLARYLPPPSESVGRDAPPSTGTDAAAAGYGFQRSAATEAGPPRIAPLEGRRPPSLDLPQSPSQAVAVALGGRAATPEPGPSSAGSEEMKRLKDVLAGFEQAVTGAAGQARTYEDMRSDLVARSSRLAPFQAGPIEGSASEGHEVSMRLDASTVAAGEIFDRPVPLSDDWSAVERLRTECAPLAQRLRRGIYPNVEQIPELQRFRTGGSLDPSRLALADVQSTIYRRHRIRERADPRGSPVLVIACDGSGSLNADQMRMLKLLAAAWLIATERTGVQVLAGLYHSGTIRQGLSGALVQWLYHPRKTPAIGRKDAVRAIASLPDSGTGAQSDALSIAFMLEEAKRLARGDRVYLVLLSDAAWNRSFNTQRSGKDEVLACFEQARRSFADKLHTTMVALGVSGLTGFEAVVDELITVSAVELKDAAAVAGKIGLYVARSMRVRRRALAES